MRARARSNAFRSVPCADALFRRYVCNERTPLANTRAARGSGALVVDIIRSDFTHTLALHTHTHRIALVCDRARGRSDVIVSPECTRAMWTRKRMYPHSDSCCTTYLSMLYACDVPPPSLSLPDCVRACLCVQATHARAWKEIWHFHASHVEKCLRVCLCVCVCARGNSHVCDACMWPPYAQSMNVLACVCVRMFVCVQA